MDFKRLFKEKRSVAFLAISLILGIMFLLLSEYTSNEKTDAEKTVPTYDEAAFAAELEKKLAGIIGNLSGVSEVSVMVSLDGGFQQCYASESSKSQAGDKISSEVFLTMQEQSGNSTPILTRMRYPEIRGVSVVCKGASDVFIRQKIIGLVASTLNLNENQIFVSE